VSDGALSFEAQLHAEQGDVFSLSGSAGFAVNCGERGERKSAPDGKL
jgi:hypothetical protein